MLYVLFRTQRTREVIAHSLILQTAGASHAPIHKCLLARENVARCFPFPRFTRTRAVVLVIVIIIIIIIRGRV